MHHLVNDLGADLRVSLVSAYGDGTIWARFEDGSGRKLEVCIDGRVGSPTRYRLFQGGQHPTKPEATLIELGSVEEDVVIQPWTKWLFSDEARREFSSDGLQMCQETLLRLGEPS